MRRLFSKAFCLCSSGSTEDDDQPAASNATGLYPVSADLADNLPHWQSVFTRRDAEQRISEYRLTPVPAPAPKPEQPIILWTKSLVDLDDDSLYLIILALSNMCHHYGYGMGRFLLPLSVMNRRLRRLVLPVIFRTGYAKICQKRWYRDGEDLRRGYYPSHIWQYFREFYVARATSKAELQQTIAALPSMRNITSLSLDGPYLTSRLISAASGIPSLVCLTLKVDRMDSLPWDRFSNLQQLVVHDRTGLGRDKEEQCVERENMSILLGSNHTTLRHLELPGEITDLIKVGILHWPQLEHLILRGFVESAPHLFANLQHLTNLTFEFRGETRQGSYQDRIPPEIIARQELHQKNRYEITPAVCRSCGMNSPPCCHLDDLVPHLEALVLSNVSENDEFYRYLPTGLQSLSVIARKEYSCHRYPLSNMKCHAIVASLSAVQLKTLHLTHAVNPTPLELVRQIAEVIPAVERLILETAFFVNWYILDREPYIDAIRPFTHLQDLRISLPFAPDRDENDEDPMRSSDRKAFVVKLANANSNLQVVGLRQYYSGGIRYSLPHNPFGCWKISRTESLNIVLHDLYVDLDEY